jgi:hypothetical protein
MPLVPELGGEGAITQTDGRLAWELAAEISPVQDILKKFGITPTEFKVKLRDKMFRTAIREAKTLWKSDLNVQQRIKLKASFLVEDSLLDIFKLIKNENSAATAKLEAFEKLMRAGDLVPRAGTKGDGALASGFKLTINLGTATQNVVIDGRTIDHEE